MKRKLFAACMMCSLLVGQNVYATDYDTVNSFGRIEMNDLNGSCQNVFDDADLVKIGTKAEHTRDELTDCRTHIAKLEDQLGGFWFTINGDGNLVYHYLDSEGNEQSGVIE